MGIDPVELTSILALVLEKAGAMEDIAREVASNLVEADMTGHGSHGARLCGNYAERLRKGLIDGAARPSLAEASGALSCASVEIAHLDS